MCGIIGVIGTDENNVAIFTRNLLDESQIRGKHATGISFLKENEGLVTIKQAVKAKDFVLPEHMGTVVIGHVRYSTSDIKYNQPLQEDGVSIVHNGVITQASFEEWEELFGYTDFSTRNDSEILLKRIDTDQGIDSWLDFENSSIACGVIIDGELCCFRNTKRPLYLFYSEEHNVIGFASTMNIIKRATKKLGEVIVMKTEANYIYNLSINMKNKVCVNSIMIKENDERDLQFDTVRGYDYLTNGKIRT